VTTPPSSSARQAQEALGARLREIRKDAGFSGRALAAATGQHFTRVKQRIVQTMSLLSRASSSAGRIWAGLARRYGPSLVLLETTPRLSPARAWRPSTWSASLLRACRCRDPVTGPAPAARLIAGQCGAAEGGDERGRG